MTSHSDPIYNAAWRSSHRSYSTEYRRTHPGQAASYAATVRFGESVPTDEWMRVWSGTCFCCGATPAEGVDHVIPKGQGGRNVLENLQPSCLSCNLHKRDH